MKSAKLGAIACIAWLGVVSAPYAQTTGETVTPAELPPSSFQGRQFVDSKGCVFIRAGIGGNTSWVPRVTRDRQQICGQKPTFLSEGAIQFDDPSVETSAIGTPARTEPRAVIEVLPGGPGAIEVLPQGTLDAPDAGAGVTAADASEDSPVVAETVSPQPDSQAQTGAQALADTQARPERKPRRVIVRRSVTEQVDPAPQRTRSTGGKHVHSHPHPHTHPHGRYHHTPRVKPAPKVIDRSERVMPKHVHDAYQERRGVRAPKGYTAVWDDDRLNIRRAEMSRKGMAQTRLIWTETVPRRLINPATGRDVTAKTPLVYPYTDKATQDRELGQVRLVQKGGKTYKYIKRNTNRAKAPVAKAPAVARAPAVQNAPQAKGRYIQVGAFGVASNAERAVRTLKQAGLPARIGRVRSKSINLVVVGPYTTQAELGKALSLARRTGFADAFVR